MSPSITANARVIEGEPGDLTNDPNAGPLVLNFSQDAYDLNVGLFLDMASEMINEDTFISVLLRFCSRQTKWHYPWQNAKSAFSLIILECAITVAKDDQTTIEGPILDWGTKTKLFWLALQSHFSLTIIVLMDSV